MFKFSEELICTLRHYCSLIYNQNINITMQFNNFGKWQLGSHIWNILDAVYKCSFLCSKNHSCWWLNDGFMYLCLCGLSRGRQQNQSLSLSHTLMKILGKMRFLYWHVNLEWNPLSRHSHSSALATEFFSIRMFNRKGD